MFRLEKLVPAPGVFAPAAPQNSDDLVAAARDNLRRAMAGRDKAGQRVAVAEAAVSRVQQLIASADEAQAALEAAESESAAYTTAWVKAGAPADEPNVSQPLKLAVLNALQEAETARVASAGARDGLSSAESALSDARLGFDTAQSKVHEGVARVLAAMTERALINARQAGEQFQVAANEVQVMARVLAGRWYSFSNDGVAGMLLQRLRDCAPPAVPERAAALLAREGEALIEPGRPFIDLGHKLLNDADA